MKYRNYPKYFFCLTLTSVLLACGGGGSSDKQNDNNNNSSNNNSNNTVAASSLSSGHCMTPVVDSLYVSDVEIKDCSDGVPYQVAGRLVFDDASAVAYPGHVQLHYSAYDACQSVFEQFTGLTFWSLNHGLDLEAVIPSPSGWNGGDRDIIKKKKKMNETQITESVQKL